MDGAPRAGLPPGQGDSLRTPWPGAMRYSEDERGSLLHRLKTVKCQAEDFPILIRLMRISC